MVRGYIFATYVSKIQSSLVGAIFKDVKEVQTALFSGPLECQELQLNHGIIFLSTTDVLRSTTDEVSLWGLLERASRFSVYFQLFVCLDNDIPKAFPERISNQDCVSVGIELLVDLVCA